MRITHGFFVVSLINLTKEVNYPAHRAGHLKTILTVLETALVHDDT